MRLRDWATEAAMVWCPCGSTLSMPLNHDHANDTKGATT
jgi:hypothetical protein